MRSIKQNDRILKRQRSQSSDQAGHISSAKEQRQLDHPDRWIPSERFWDTLPKIYLTRRALVEHDRRCRLKDSKLSTLEKAQRRQSTRLRQFACREQLPSLRSANHRKPSLELRRFARHGGPDLTTIRGFPDPTMSDRTSRPSRRKTITGLTPSSKRSGPYDPNYQLKLAQAGVHLKGETDKNGNIVLPANYYEITARLNNARSSLSPSRFTENDFQRFCRETEQEDLESEVMQKSMTIIEGANGHYSRMGGPYNNLKPFDPELAMAVPDSYDGAPPLSIDHRILKDLGGYIVPNTDSSRPAVPNFHLEGKSRKGRADVARRQAAHVGAIGARGMMSLQSYPPQAPQHDNKAYSFTNTYHDGTLKMYTTHATAPKTSNERPQYNNKAYSFTNTYHDGQLKMYTTHATAPETSNERPQYYMSQLRTFAMTDSSKTFREGATHYRNARDLSKEQRDTLIQQANRTAQQMPTSKHSNRSHTTVNTASRRVSGWSEEQENSQDTDNSSDELAYGKVFKQSRNAKLTDDDEDYASRTSFTRSTPRFNRDAANLTEVHTRRARQGAIPGRVYAERGCQVFIRDEEWQEAKIRGRDGWVNWEHEVYYLDS